MIDIHCHILPGVDDGAADLEESLAMVRLAAESGVTRIVATPHFHGEEESMQMLPRVLSRLNTLKREVKRFELPVTIHPGVEILCTPQTPSLAQQGKLPTIGNSRYILTEFFFDETLEYMELMLDQLTRWGYQPVVAHPERYQAVQRRPQVMQRWFAKGYILQLNKGSILGSFGTRAETTATDLLKRGLAHVIASDAHHADFRTTHMSAIAAWGREYLGEEYTSILLQKNPGQILQGKPVIPAR